MRLPLLCLLLVMQVPPPAGAVSISACEGTTLCGAGDPPLIHLNGVALAPLPPAFLPTTAAGGGSGAEEPSSLSALFCTLLSSSASCLAPLQLVDSSSSTAPSADSNRSLIGICPKACVEQLRHGS